MQNVLAFLFWSLVFGISYTQAPLYYSNQNQYFLHGLAKAGRGDLDRDWLANTKDPTPIFSGLVACTARYLHEGLFHVYYLLILGLYFHCLVGLFTFLAPVTPNMPARLCFITFFVVLHAGVVRLASTHLLGVDYPWFLQAGVAGQYILGFGLQPSVFGVFLLASILAFLRDHPWRAIVWACLAAVLHATYLPAAALLTLAYMALRYRRRGLRAAILLGGFALVLVLPSVLYNLAMFAPTSATDFAEAQRILAEVRLPHHAVVARWFDGIALAQILWIVLAMFLARRSNLFLIILIPFLGSLILTLIQLATGNDTLALLFPWRTSAILVPLATTVILSRLVVALEPRQERLESVAKVAYITTCGLALGACCAGGLAIGYFELGYHSNNDELPLLEFVKTHRRPGDVYLVPVEVPKPPSGRGIFSLGAFSTNFRPAPQRGKAGGLIAVDLQGFRLTTGAALYVDFKSIPYQDAEVLEWYERVRWCQKVYGKTLGEDVRAELAGKGITHVVVPAASILTFAGLGAPLYQDAANSVYPVAKK
ncbi:MAG TPA: DUF6798 domain-containing protein [Gemmataceae bacterium]|jgi:hypothetical protein|nr:DUF6798 domain-containing protein [Gemmataceae bacterium]